MTKEVKVRYIVSQTYFEHCTNCGEIRVQGYRVPTSGGYHEYCDACGFVDDPYIRVISDKPPWDD